MIIDGVKNRVRQILPALALNEFTAFAGVKQGQHERLRRLLSQQKVLPAKYDEVQCLHNLRWILLAPTEKSDVEPGHDTRWALVFSIVFDGTLDDILSALSDFAREDFSQVLKHCNGFSDSTDPMGYLRSHRIRSGFLYRDLGPILLDEQAAGSQRERYPCDVTLAEIKDAFRLHEELAEFQANQPGKNTAANLRDAFLKRFEDTAFPFPLLKCERRAAFEDRYARLVSEMMERAQRRAARSALNPSLRRSVHAKGHGFVQATFEVERSLERKYRIGIFSRSGSYEAFIRPSNGMSSVNEDRAFDARGLAMSLALPDDLPGAHLRPTERRCQDFVLLSAPVFVVPDVRRALELLSIVEADGIGGKFLAGASFLCSRRSGRQAWLIARTAIQRLRHPLAATFSSTTPYALGEKFIAKYSIEAAKPRELEAAARESEDKTLRGALKTSSQTKTALKFYLHVLDTSGPFGKLSVQDVVEDATLDWDQLGAEKVHAATITIAEQDPTTSARLAEAEEWEFNPWNALEVHRPLGSLNRARWTAYAGSARRRRLSRAPTPTGKAPAPTPAPAAAPEPRQAAE